MSAWSERMERLLLQFEAGTAQKRGIDIFQPGWRDEYLKLRDQDDIFHLIATPHVDHAIDGMEEQFTDGTSGAPPQNRGGRAE